MATSLRSNVLASERKTDYADTDLTFFMLVHGDHELADGCLSRLRRHFPDSRVVVRTDGDDDPRHDRLVARFGVELRREPRRFAVEHGGALIERMFELFFERPSRYLFKIDPDTHVHRRFHYLPARSGHFGTLQGKPGGRSVQGGCMGFTIDAAREVVASDLLRHAGLRDPGRLRHVSHHWKVLANRADRVGLGSFDWTLGWIAAERGIPLFDFPEVHSTWNDPVDNSDLRFAITHPIA